MAKTKTNNAKPKKEILIGLLKRAQGASIDDIVKATGWQPHSSRAALTGLRKAGYAIDSEKTDDVRRHRIDSEPAR